MSERKASAALGGAILIRAAHCCPLQGWQGDEPQLAGLLKRIGSGRGEGQTDLGLLQLRSQYLNTAESAGPPLLNR